MSGSHPGIAPHADPTRGGRFGIGLRVTPFGAFLAVAIAVAAFAAVTTQGFLTVANLKAILFTGSFVGIAAVGTTVIMLSGNLFSLSLGTSISVGAIAFLSALRYGLAIAIVLTLLLGFAIFAVQGAVVGMFAANPIIVSISAGAIQAGLVTWLTAGTQVTPSGSSAAYQQLGGSMLGVPFGFYALVGFTLVTAFLLNRTPFGRSLYLVGENRKAARSAGLRIGLLTAGAFAVAGVAATGSGIVLGAFNGTATLSIGGTYTYDAVAAALVGGNAIQGGRGSVWRAFFGAFFIESVSDLLLLRGYSTGVQILVEGIAVVVAVVLVQVAGAEATVTGVTEALKRDRLAFGVFGVAALSLALLPEVSNATVTYLNVYNVLQTFADYGLLALAVGLSMIIGEYDLSTASLYGLAGMVAVMAGAGSPAWGILAALAVGLGGGLFQGAIITRLRLAAVPVTLGGFIVYLGITYVISHNNDVTYDRIDVGLRLDQPIAWIFSIRSLITIAGFLLIASVFQLTRIGPEVGATGGDRRASRISGVRVDRVVIGVLAASGFLAAAAGALHSYSLSSAQPDLGFNPLIFATIAALVGGIRLAGGRGTPLGIAAGVLSLAILQEILAAIAAPQYTGDLVTGVLLLLVTIFASPILADWWERRSRAETSTGAAPTSQTL